MRPAEPRGAWAGSREERRGGVAGAMRQNRGMTMPSPGRPANRLAGETSPYLLQHAHNPVDWFPWGPEAFEKARKEDRPVFLSIGYSACHWCHVMERESFESDEIARILNEGYVSVKVDREERPDVDDVYMTAVQALVGRGGWPLSAFLFPDGRPFFGGTYFPPDDRGHRPGFRTLLLGLLDAWRDRRSELEEAASRIVGEVERANGLTDRLERAPLGPATLDRLTDALSHAFDARHGGFGGAPKFPPHLALEWLLRKGAEGDGGARAMAARTLEAMALGGVHDHLGGGFHRYSTDERWLVPHFEKMLTDNAQLLALYARAFVLTGRDLFRRVARGVGDYLLAEMRGAEGGFFAATDADSEGAEGKFFVWSEAEVREVLGGGDADLFCRHYRVFPEGNFHDEATGRPTGLNILHLASEPSAEEERRLAPLREKLKARRAGRVPPGLDDKRIAGWNALAVSGLAVASRAVGEPVYLDAARSAARFVLGRMRDAGGRLLRSWKGGDAKVVAFLEDEAFLALALLDLAEAEPEEEAAAEWLAEARRVVAVLRRRFRRPGRPGFTFTGEGNEPLLVRGRDLWDKAIPSGSGAATLALVRLAARDRDAALAAEALEALEDASGLMARAPHGTESWHVALAELLESGLVGTGEDGTVGGRAAGTSGEPRPDARGGSEVPRADVPVMVTASASSAVLRPGEAFEVALAVTVAEGWALTGDGALRVEAWGGPDLFRGGVRVPPPTAVAHEDGTTEPGYEGTVPAVLAFQVSPDAAEGEYAVSVSVRYRACGDGRCLPERAAALTVPLEVRRGGRT